jgi:hypothetical protein
MVQLDWQEKTTASLELLAFAKYVQSLSECAVQGYLSIKFTCNSNVAVITDGPIGMYACKYINKPNEKDDTIEYAQVEATMKKMADEGRKHQDDKSEALCLICRAAFAHN